ncbi:amidohydrolase family protein [Niabella ginsengisoli]|uniref:Amidohydrolase family protein n=1 Tax=Niabella ginsengisoli TaxID=522298 RepID=A0ABS9SK44_9BACT|nr:amidohydrolase family protein [Niabella ginsengisoli]MCH5598752.1 amidohydrolase family protein [Niabella ginsengisoli]
MFEKKQKLFIHADVSKQILVAVDFAKKFDIDIVLVGGSDSYLVADLLKQNNIPVILNALHSLPTMQDDDVDQPFKTPAILQKAGVLFAINDNSDNAKYRNLDFNAGTAVAYGLTKEQALAAITINPAKILGIDQQTGSIETGKDANIIICDGDVLDMRSSVVTDAFIQGRKVNLDNKQNQLYERYKHRYGIMD